MALDSDGDILLSAVAGNVDVLLLAGELVLLSAIARHLFFLNVGF